MKSAENEEWAQGEGKKSFLERLMNLLGFETQIEFEEVYDENPKGGKTEPSSTKERGKVVSSSGTNKTT